MFKDKAEMLITALKSGEYKKGSGKLCRIDQNGNKAFCCLGVLSELAIKNKISVIQITEPAFLSTDNHVKYDESPYGLSKNTAKWAGIDMDDEYELSVLNDDSDTWDEVIEYLEIMEYKENL